MVISAELHAHILRYYHVEKWRAGTIARQIGVHRDVVARVLAQSGLAGPMQRPMRIDPYLPFILKTLEAFPTLTAARLYAMVYERGYRPRPLPPSDRPPSSAPQCRGLPAPSRPSRRGGPGRSGHYRSPSNRARPAAVDGLRDGAELGRAAASCVSSSTPAWMPSSPATPWRSRRSARYPGGVHHDNLKSAVLERCAGRRSGSTARCLAFAARLSL